MLLAVRLLSTHRLSLCGSSNGRSTVFRYDLVFELVSAIVEGRDAVPGFDDGASAQAVADAVLQSYSERRWIDVPM